MNRVDVFEMQCIWCKCKCDAQEQTGLDLIECIGLYTELIGWHLLDVYYLMTWWLKEWMSERHKGFTEKS